MQCSIWSNREHMAQLGEQVFSVNICSNIQNLLHNSDISCKCSRHDHHLTSAFHKHRAPRILKAQLNKGHKHRTTQLLPKHLTSPNRILFCFKCSTPKIKFPNVPHNNTKILTDSIKYNKEKYTEIFSAFITPR